jgi:microcompartment protein CcmK/EutM
VAIREGRYSQEYIDEMSEEPLFDILYNCHFPQPDAVDEKGWIPLLSEEQIRTVFVEGGAPFGERRLGVDVAGGGRNESVIVLRASNYAKLLHKTHDGDTMKLAGEVHRLGNDHRVKPSRVFIDKVGVGKGVVDKLRSGSANYVGISGADKPIDERFANARAEMFWRLRKWILSGGTLEADEGWLQLARIKYKVQDGTGKLIIMSKQEMLREGVESPDKADALSLTFARPDTLLEEIYGGTTFTGSTPVFDPYE